MVLGLIKSKALTRIKTTCIYKPVKREIINMPSVKGKGKLNKCNKCEKRHPPPTRSKCTRGETEDNSFVETDEQNNSTSLDPGNMNILLSQHGLSCASDPVASELSNMTKVMCHLIARIDSQDARISDLAKQLPNAILKSTEQSEVQTGGHTHTSSLEPTLQQLHGDPSLVSQAHRQLNQLEDENTGALNCVHTTTRSAKRGLARLGGENAPIINIPWPHDYVLGEGEKRRLHYGDLNWAQFVQGYATIMEREPQHNVVRSMISHLKF
jgi:hypothetical protein